MVFLGEPDWSSFSSKGKEDARGFTYAPANSEQRDNTLDRTSFGGRATHYGPNGEVVGSSGQQAAANYTSLGQAAAQRGAYQNDWAQNNASRGQQGTALGYMQNAAYGGAPSQAEMLGRNQIDQSLNAQMAAAASARGGSLAQAAAMRNAANMGDASRQQGMNQLSALRAQEMAQARGDYFGAASGMRGQDIGQQGMNMQSELAQRQLNQQGQQFYDQMGWNTQRADQEAAMHQASIDSAEYQAQKQANQHSEDRNTNVISSTLGAVGSFFSSDITAKTDVQPLSGPARQSPFAISAPSAGPSMMRGGAMAARPPMMLSDAHAKREAFLDGLKFAQGSHAYEQGKGESPRAPAYLNNAPASAAGGQAAQAVVPRQTPENAREEMAARATPQPVAASRPPLAAAMPAPAPSTFARIVQMVPAAPVVSDDRAKVIGDGALRGAAEGMSNDVDLDRLSGENYGGRHPEFVADPQADDLDATSYRDGSSDPRTNRFDKSFHRDTPADQARVKRGVEDKASRDADAMMAGYGAALAKGPATEEAMARANRSMAGSSYAYKPEFTPPDQAPGEKNVGPMAQNMAADPLAQTAVKQDPQSGMLMLDGQKMLKLNSAGIASLQRQIDSLGAAIAKRGRS